MALTRQAGLCRPVPRFFSRKWGRRRLEAREKHGQVFIANRSMVALREDGIVAHKFGGYWSR